MRALAMIKIDIGEKKLKDISEFIEDGTFENLEEYIAYEIESWLAESFNKVSVETIEMERPSWN